MRRRRNTTALAARLGITQELLSIFLGVGRTSITMFELGVRPMPDEGSFKISMMMHAFHSDRKPASLENYEAKESAQVCEMLEKSIKINEGKLLGLQIKLRKCCENYTREANGLRTAGLLLENPPPFSESPDADKKWLQNMEADAWYRMQRYGKDVQVRLQLKMEVLEFEIAAAKKKLADLKPIILSS